ncbi:MAG: Hsp20/alpha crystallin family protein [Deltaproteobacteria bacterium]|nr:Hsp20/alpha crystallin family protein [Deltaproteobacteria bacterium]
MALVRWIPFKDLLFFQDRMSRIFDEALEHYFGEGSEAKCSWMPPADTYETKSHITIKVEIPGVKIEDVGVEVDGSILTLKGMRELRGIEGEHYHRIESSYGVFKRSFNMASEIDKEGIKANLSNGVLEVVVPKKESSGEQIKVKVKH